MQRPHTETPDFGTTRLNFDVDGHGGFILLPTYGAERGQWVWYAPSFVDVLPKPRHVWYISRLLQSGFCVCGVDVGESWGNPFGREVFTRFHEACVSEFGLNAKACLWCQSRGGLMHYNWAAENPERVKCIGGIYPVVDASSPRLRPSVAEAYGMPEPALMKVLGANNPIERLQSIAEAGIPIFNLHGDVDEIVPLELNSGELTKRYEALGGQATLQVVAGKGHEEVREFFECPALVDFFVEPSKA